MLSINTKQPISNSRVSQYIFFIIKKKLMTVVPEKLKNEFMHQPTAYFQMTR